MLVLRRPDQPFAAVCRVCTRQRFASSILNLFSLCGLASRRAASAAWRKLCGIRGLAGEHGFRFGRAPWLGSNSAQGDPDVTDIATIDRHHHCGRGESEFVRRAIPQLQINLLASCDRRRQRDMRDKVARFKHRLTIWRVAGQKVEIAEWEWCVSPWVPARG